MKRILLSFVILLSAALFMAQMPILPGILNPQTVSGGGQHLLFSDAFGGTATTLLHSYSANWITSQFSNQWLDCEISTPNGGVSASNTGVPCGDSNNSQTWTNDQYAQATLVAIPSSSVYVCVRMTGDGSNNPQGYCAGYHGGSYELQRFAGGGTLLTTFSAPTPSTSDVMNLQIKGTTITLLINGGATTPATTTDSTYSTGNPGLHVNNSSTTLKELSTFSAGSVT